MDAELRANCYHYHVWPKARTGRIRYRLDRGFNSRQAALQWAKRNKGDRSPTVERCDLLKCAPRFD